MQKYNSKNTQSFGKPQGKKPDYSAPKDKSVNRFWGNAARLEHTNVRNKNKGKKG